METKHTFCLKLHQLLLLQPPPHLHLDLLLFHLQLLTVQEKETGSEISSTISWLSSFNQLWVQSGTHGFGHFISYSEDGTLSMTLGNSGSYLLLINSLYVVLIFNYLLWLFIAFRLKHRLFFGLGGKKKFIFYTKRFPYRIRYKFLAIIINFNLQNKR